MLTLDERIRAVLEELAMEPTKYEMIGTGDGDWGSNTYVEGREVCVFCRSDRKYKHGTFSINHDLDCIVREAKAILHDHPKD